MLTHFHVVALNDGPRRKFFFQEFNDQRLNAFGALRQRLQDEHVVVDVDYQGWQEVALGIDEAIGIGLLADSHAPCGSGSNSLSPPFAIDRLAGLSEEAQGNLRRVAIERLTNEVSVLIANVRNGSTGRRLGVKDITAINPEMTVADAIGAAFVDFNFIHVNYSAICGMSFATERIRLVALPPDVRKVSDRSAAIPACCASSVDSQSGRGFLHETAGRDACAPVGDLPHIGRHSRKKSRSLSCSTLTTQWVSLRQKCDHALFYVRLRRLRIVIS